MKYLGIELSSNINNILCDNMGKMLCKIRSYLDKWDKLNMTLWGKVNSIKMVIVPLSNYFKGMLPMCIPHPMLIRYNNMIKTFLWRGGKTCININRVCQPKKEGGLALQKHRALQYLF